MLCTRVWQCFHVPSTYCLGVLLLLLLALLWCAQAFQHLGFTRVGCHQGVCSQQKDGQWYLSNVRATPCGLSSNAISDLQQSLGWSDGVLGRGAGVSLLDFISRNVARDSRREFF